MKRPGGIPLMKAAESPQKNVLNDVLRVLALPQHPKTESEQRILKSLDELTERGFFPSQTALDQFSIAFGHQIPAVP